MNDIVSSVDKIVICGNLNGIYNLETYLFESNEVARTGFSQYPYRKFVLFKDGSYLSIGEISAVRQDKVKEIRYEFNPNRLLYKSLHIKIMSMLKDTHFTRIDVAMDVRDVDMSDWEWMDLKARPSRIYRGRKMETESHYVGGKDSELLYRIYDKAKEQKLEDCTWWRIEVQFRGQVAEAYYEYVYGFNPFDDVYPVKKRHFGELDIKERAMCHYLMDYPSGFAELSVNTRGKYKKLIAGLGSWVPINLKEIWKKNNPLVESELQSWKNLSM